MVQKGKAKSSLSSEIFFPGDRVSYECSFQLLEELDNSGKNEKKTKKEILSWAEKAIASQIKVSFFHSFLTFQAL